MTRKVFKIITSGEGAVGKTTLLHRYIENTFKTETMMTIGVQFFKKELVIDDIQYDLIIWDFGGQEQFRTILSSYIEGAIGVLFMFDLSNIARSLRNIDMWWSLLNRRRKIPIILIGTKADVIDKKEFLVHEQLIQETREKFSFVDYIETSSKTGQNIQKAFEILIKNIIVFEKSNENPPITNKSS